MFRNAHQAVNEYRPHQAREALILLMEGQVERGQSEKKGIEELKAKVDEVLAGLGEGLNQGGNGDGADPGQGAGANVNGNQTTERKKNEAEKRMWEVLREEVGS